MRAFVAGWALIAMMAAPLAAGVRIQGAAYTEGAAASVEVRVWQIGPPLAEHPERLWEPVATATAKPGEPFALALPEGVALPVRVEVAAPGHVAAAFEAVLPEQAALPPVWLRAGKTVPVRVSADGSPAAGAAIEGWAAPDGRWGSGWPGWWRAVVARSIVDEDGRAEIVLPPPPGRLELTALATDGAWGRLRQPYLESAALTVPLVAQPVEVRVVDERDRPVAGVRVAPADGPPGTAAVSGEDGRARVRVRRSTEPSGFGEDGWQILALGQGMRGLARGHAAPPAVVRLEVEPVPPVEVRWPADLGPVVVEPHWIPRALMATPLAAAGGSVELSAPDEMGVLTAHGPGVGPAMAQVPAAAGALDLALKPAARIRGRVVRADGGAATGIPVWAAVPNSTSMLMRARGIARQDMLSQEWLPWAVTGPSGGFELGSLPAAPAELEARAPGLPPVRSDRLALEEGRLTEVTLRVVPGAEVSLTVHDPDGASVAGATVRARPTAGRNDRMMQMILGDRFQGGEASAAGVSGEDGTVRLAAVPVGPVDLSVEAPGFVTRRLETVEVPPEGTDVGIVTLTPGATVAGRTVDEDGAAVPDAQVHLSRSVGRFGGELPAARSDGEGRFTIADLEPEGEVYLWADAEGLVAAPPVRVVLPPEGEVEVPLLAEQVVHGLVVDAADGRPVEGAHVLASRSAGGGSGLAGEATTDDGGLFRLGGLQQGDLVLQVTAEGFRNGDELLTLPREDPDRPVHIELERGTTVSGRVLGADGAPVSGAWVSGAATASRAVRAGFSISRGVPSGPDGRFTLSGLPDGELRLGARAEDGASGEARWSPGDGEAEIRLEPAGEVEVRVLDEENRPQAQVPVEAYAAGFSGRLDTGADGVVLFEGVPPGELTVRAISPGWQRVEERVAVHGGEPARVVLRFSGGVVEGRVVGLSERELERCIVNRTPVRPDGTFRLEGVGFGRQQVMARVVPAGRSRSVVVEVPQDGPPPDVEIDFGGGVELSGRVTRSGDPITGATVSAALLGGSGRSTVTDGAGAFAIRDLEPGEYRVDATDPLGRVVATESVLVTDDTEIELRAATAVVTGWVVSAADRQPVEGATVHVSMAGVYQMRRHVAVDAGGSFALEELPAGDLIVEAVADGYTTARRTLTLADGASEELTLLLERDIVLELAVTRSDGSTPEAVSVLAAQGDVGFHYTSADCGGDGRCRVTSLPSGAYTLAVAAAGERALLAAAVPGEASVRLRPSGSLRVHAGPAADGTLWRVRLVDLTSGLTVPVPSWRGGDGAWLPVGPAGEAFTLAAGRYRVEAYDPDAGLRSSEVDVPAGGEATAAF